MSNKKPLTRRAARAKEASARMRVREKRFVKAGNKSFDRRRAALRRRNKLKAYGMLICMNLVMRDGMTNLQMERMANTLRNAGFVALVERPGSIRLHSEPGLAMAFMARADMGGVLGPIFRRDLGRIFRDSNLIRRELREHVERLERLFPSIASVEPPQGDDED
jgi:hypothetical protein